MNVQKKRKTTKKAERSTQGAKKVPAKRAKVQERAVAIVEDDSNIVTSDHAPVGQLAKSQRCTQYWTRLEVAAARDTGGILMKHGEVHTPDSNVASMKYSELDEIRSSKKYAKGQQEVTQNETLLHYANLQMIKKLNNKRTVDLKMVCVYQAIVASLNPKHAEIRYRPKRVVIADTINIYMHLAETEEVQLAQLRQALVIIQEDAQVEIETREGLIAFIRRYTEDDYFTKKDQMGKGC